MVCVKCVHQVYNDENDNPESFSKSQELSCSNSSVSSSSSIILSENAVLTESLPPSQIPERLLESDTIAEELPNDLNSSIFHEMLPPEKIPQYKKIISMLAPQSIKRKRALAFIAEAKSVEVQKAQDGREMQNVMMESTKAKIREKITPSENIPKRPRLEASDSTSSSSQHRSASLPNSLQAVEERLAVLGEKSANLSQVVQRSPAADINDAIYRRREPSLSLTSLEDESFLAVAPKTASASKPGPSSTKAPAPKIIPAPARSMRSSVSKGSRPMPAPVQRKANDGNDHTNMGAPRRVNYNVPVTATGAHSRNVRTGSKLVFGG